MTALAADGNQICSSAAFTFTKPGMPGNAPQEDGGSEEPGGGGGNIDMGGG